MKVAKDSVVSIHYTLTNDQGTQLDSSQGKDPLAFLQGYQNIIPGLEKEIEGKAKGDKFKTSIAPADAYGEKSAELVQTLPRENFPNPEALQVGMQFSTSTENGEMVFQVTNIQDNQITVDANHPLAGTTLNFEIEIMDVRKATDEELAHGHVHGPGGHHH
jgi:FKBP-type peptidyl-prolyl cis-trans isomerase SlyD